MVGMSEMFILNLQVQIRQRYRPQLQSPEFLLLVQFPIPLL